MLYSELESKHTPGMSRLLASKKTRTVTVCLLAILFASIGVAQSSARQVYPPVNSRNNETESLYIALMMSFGGDYTSSGAIPGVQVALDQINADPSILPGYTLHYTLRDSQCQRTVALDAFFAEIVQEPVNLAMIGAGCSVATEPIAEVSQYYNIVHLSCVSSSPALANNDRFRSYFQLLANEVVLAGGFYSIIKEFEWSKVGIITQNENVFTLTMDSLKDILDRNNVSSTEKIFLSDDGIEDLETPFEPGVRIFILAMYSSHARELICKAYNEGLRYPKYLFLLYGWYEQNWWMKDPGDMLNCTKEERETVLEYSLAIQVDEFITDDSAIADTGINGSEFKERYQLHLQNSFFAFNESLYSQSCYDATWALAYALNNTHTEITNRETSNETENANTTFNKMQLNNFTYENVDLRSIISKHLEQTSFLGLTGSVRFRNTTRKNITVLQYKGTASLELVTIATVVEDNGTDQFRYANGREEIWRDDIAPYDGVPVEMKVHTSLALAVVIYILAAAGVVFAIVCLVFNFAFRQRKLIRLSSPNLNYLIGAGAIILYIDLCFFPVPSTDPTAVSVACNLTAWLTALGYSLCYGTIVVKMWRIYYLFHDPLVKKKNITDWMLALAVLLLVVIDLIILVVYTAVEGARGNLEANRKANAENPVDIEGEIEFTRRFYAYLCDSKARDIFLGVLYGYKGTLQILALVLSFGIRKVKVKGLDDSKYIAAAVYVTSIVLAVVIVATYTLNDYVNGFPALVSIGFFIGTTFILLLVFIPKMVGLYRDPHGENVFSKSELSDPTDTLGTRKLSNTIGSHDSSMIEVDKTEVDGLKARIKELETITSREGILKEATHSETTQASSEVILEEDEQLNSNASTEKLLTEDEEGFANHGTDSSSQTSDEA